MRRGSLILSGALHVGFIVVAVLGLPFMPKREFVIPPAVIVDLIEVGKVTETTQVAQQPTPKPEKPVDPDKPAPAAKNTANTAVAPTAKEEPKPEEKKEEEKKPEKQQQEIDENAVPDKKKKDDKKKDQKPKPKPDPSKDFSSVLKNLAETKDKPPVKSDTPDLKLSEETQKALGMNAPLGVKMTISEQDALRAQLEACWNVPFGAKDAENMAVEIFMVINPDRTLREARVVDQARYNSDTFFRAAADSALRAVRSSLCSPFNLPADKYDTWNKTTVTFNPKDMF